MPTAISRPGTITLFFSSRRRHTRFDCDWSSDVCSSDLQEQLAAEFPDNLKDVAAVIEEIEYRTMRDQVLSRGERVDGRDLATVRPVTCEVRSEERRGGEEGRSRWSPYH